MRVLEIKFRLLKCKMKTRIIRRRIYRSLVNRHNLGQLPLILMKVRHQCSWTAKPISIGTTRISLATNDRLLPTEVAALKTILKTSEAQEKSFRLPRAPRATTDRFLRTRRSPWNSSLRLPFSTKSSWSGTTWSSLYSCLRCLAQLWKSPRWAPSTTRLRSWLCWCLCCWLTNRTE